jgi:hypothetical protein
MSETGGTRMTQGKPVTGWVGWVWFAGLMLIVVGLFNVIDGLVAIVKHNFFIPTQVGLLVFNLTGWGWIHLILGILLVIVGFAVLTGQLWARIAAVVLVILNAVTQLLFLSAYPIWSLIVIILDVIVLYALIVHGEEAKTVRQ